MKIELELPFSEEALRTALEYADRGKAEPLRSLCQKEVERFERAVSQHPSYKDGLVVIERRAVEGYLYQKLRGHVDASTAAHNSTEER
jgi:hypothetical protein